MFRGAGLALAEVKEMFSGGSSPSISILEKRLFVWLYMIIMGNLE